MPDADLSAAMRGICAAAVVIPAITIARVEDAVPVARALCAGGLRVIEVMFRNAAAQGCIRAIAGAVPEAIVGAGTLLRPADIDAARAAGAKFAVSPGATGPLLDAASAAGMPLLPGAATASEAMALADRGWTMLKFFPAEASGGAPALGAFAGPLPHIAWCPTGGVGLANAPAYRNLPNVLCVGGSWPVPAEAVAAGDWARIEMLAREAAAL
jgi:2-dehydro-3-deoxyphosphogluconate aldolase/(4S)-4-hydroxy-2-oxoglutarate aldolase